MDKAIKINLIIYIINTQNGMLDNVRFYYQTSFKNRNDKLSDVDLEYLLQFFFN